MPLVDRITEMKCIHVLRSSGKEDDLVKSLVSVVEMLPTTLLALSSTASDDMPSSSSIARASASGRSPLENRKHAEAWKDVALT